MVLVRKHIQGFAIICLMFFVFSFFSVAFASSLAELLKRLKAAWDVIRQILSAIGLIQLTISQLESNNQRLQSDINSYESRVASMESKLVTQNERRRGLEGYIRSADKKIKAAQDAGNQDEVNRWEKKKGIAVRRLSATLNEIGILTMGINTAQNGVKRNEARIRSNNEKIRQKQQDQQRKKEAYDSAVKLKDQIQQEINNYNGDEGDN